jgi:hypothetical protein
MFAALEFADPLSDLLVCLRWRLVLSFGGRVRAYKQSGDTHSFIERSKHLFRFSWPTTTFFIDLLAGRQSHVCTGANNGL